MNLVGDKNINSKILDELDDRELFNFCITDKSASAMCTYEPFWMNRLRRRYPYLVEFKTINETWKTLYLRMSYYITKLNEEYGIPYIPVKEYDPSKFYNENKEVGLLTSGSNIFKYRAMMIAIIGDSLDIVKQMIEKGVDDFDSGLREASSVNNKKIVDLFIKNGASDLNGAMSEAGKNGHLDMVKYLNNIGASDYGYLLFAAVEGKHKEIMEYAAKKGVRDFEYDIAIDGEKDPDIINYLKELKARYVM